LLSVAASSAHAKEGATCSESRIHIATVGSTDVAKQFIFLLEQALSKRGFTIVESPDAADIILSGAVTVSDDRGNSFENIPVASVAATLVSKTGQQIWRGYFKPHPGFHAPSKLSLEIRASDLAKDLADKCRDGWPKK